MKYAGPASGHPDEHNTWDFPRRNYVRVGLTDEGICLGPQEEGTLVVSHIMYSKGSQKLKISLTTNFDNPFCTDFSIFFVRIFFC